MLSCLSSIYAGDESITSTLLYLDLFFSGTVLGTKPRGILLLSYTLSPFYFLRRGLTKLPGWPGTCNSPASTTWVAAITGVCTTCSLDCILSVPQRPMCWGFGLHTGRGGGRTLRKKVGSSERKLGHWGSVPLKAIWDPFPFLFSLLPGRHEVSLLPQVPTSMYCLITSSKSMDWNFQDCEPK